MLYWCGDTIALPFETGIQRVTRRLGAGLARRGEAVLPVGFDPATRLLRLLEPTPAAGLDAWTAAGSDWLLVPEIPTTLRDGVPDPTQLARAYGLRSCAIVHDLIPIRLAGLYEAAAQALFRRYFRMFAAADLVLATTELVAGHLRAFLASEGLCAPRIAVVPLPAQFAGLPRATRPPPARDPGAPLRLLAVSTWEPRKNLPKLLRAVRRAREKTAATITLTLVGRRDHYPVLDAEMEGLLAQMPDCVAHHRIGDDELAALYAGHHASVYPSPEEGFGLPVLESLWLGRPCVCHCGSAMAEVAPGGGTLMIDMADEAAIAAALQQLADDDELLPRLATELAARPLRTWDDYAGGVLAALNARAATAA